MDWLWVGAGGIIGTILRYQLSRFAGQRMAISFPLMTLLINVTGSYLLGLFTRDLGLWIPHHTQTAMVFLGIGFCGAFTTFSTFTYEVMILLREGRTRTALLYGSASLLFGLSASAVGLFGIP